MNVECAICKDDLFTGEGGDSICSTNCGHLFHYHCILQWIPSSGTCPNCRQIVKVDNLLKLNVHGNIEAPSITPFSKTITNRSLRSNQQSNNYLQSNLELKNTELELKIKELSLKNIQLRQMESNYKEAEKENDVLRLENDKLKKEMKRLENLLQCERERNTIIRSDLRIIDIIDLDQEGINRNETIDITL